MEAACSSGVCDPSESREKGSRKALAVSLRGAPDLGSSLLRALRLAGRAPFCYMNPEKSLNPIFCACFEAYLDAPRTIDMCGKAGAPGRTRQLAVPCIMLASRCFYCKESYIFLFFNAPSADAAGPRSLQPSSRRLASPKPTMSPSPGQLFWRFDADSGFPSAPSRDCQIRLKDDVFSR